MKKIILMFSLIVSGVALAQSDNIYVYDEPELTTMDVGDNPAGPGDPVNSSPIDQYIPVLLLFATALTFAYANKKRLTENN
ncbi:hypothetical protein [Chryseobacterium sp. GP-SGM7]|uniref:hypothetical protein n=1 Tax=Chryseobacterium sp. GP-SGM7 TaxID=3411323 RepID=UPI003B964C6A